MTITPEELAALRAISFQARLLLPHAQRVGLQTAGLQHAVEELERIRPAYRGPSELQREKMALEHPGAK